MSEHQEYLYKASAWGKVFHGLKTNEALGAGSAGPGKTTVLLNNDWDIVNHEHERCKLPRGHPHRLEFGDGRNPGTSVAWILFLRRTSPMLDQTLKRALRIFRRVDPGVRFVQDNTGGSGTFMFSSGLHYQFASCRDIGAYERFMSNEYVAVNFDELVQFDKEQYDQIKSRIRTSDPLLEKFLRCRAMSNPVMRREGEENFTVRNKNWVRERFVDPEPMGGVVLKKKVIREKDQSEEWRTRIYLPATLYDNPDAAFVRQYELNLLDAPPHMQRALLFGDWYMTEGSFFGEYWKENVHSCESFPIPKTWIRFRSMDWGFKTYGCIHWWALSPDDTLVCERELTFKGKMAFEVARKVIEIEEGMGLARGGVSEITGPADDQIREERGDASSTKEQEFINNGVSWVMANKTAGSRKRASELLVKRLKAHRGRNREPGILLFNCCHRLKRDIADLQSDKDDQNMPNDGPQNHWYASCRYALSYADVLSGGVISESVDDDGFFEGNDNRGQYGYGEAV
jgi:hypothetical protein